MSDVPVGAFLSGGLDSGLLVAMLAKRVGVKHLPTFTIKVPHFRFDEAPHARAVSRLYGTEHHEQTFSPALISRLPDVIHHLDEPSDPLSLCAYQVSALAHQHVKVVLGGDGGDELFGGYDRYYGNVYASYYGRVPSSVRRVLGMALPLIPESGWYKSVGHQLRWLHRLSFLTGGERYAASLSYFYFDREQRRALFTSEASRALRESDPEGAIREPFDRGQGDIIDRMMYADSKVRLPDHPAMITDRMSMAHGLEARSPFMDHRLAEFVARLRSTDEGSRSLAPHRATPARGAISASRNAYAAQAGIRLRPALRAAAGILAPLRPLSHELRAGVRGDPARGADSRIAEGASRGPRGPRQPALAAHQRGALVSTDDPGGQPRFAAHGILRSRSARHASAEIRAAYR